MSFPIFRNASVDTVVVHYHNTRVVIMNSIINRIGKIKTPSSNSESKVSEFMLFNFANIYIYISLILTNVMAEIF